MDQSLIASIRKNLEGKSTEELRRAYASADKAARSPEELEAMRQLLDERRTGVDRIVFALALAIVFGVSAAACAWWQDAPGALVVLAGVGGAVLGFASCYVPYLIPRV